MSFHAAARFCSVSEGSAGVSGAGQHGRTRSIHPERASQLTGKPVAGITPVDTRPDLPRRRRRSPLTRIMTKRRRPINGSSQIGRRRPMWFATKRGQRPTAAQTSCVRTDHDEAPGRPTVGYTIPADSGISPSRASAVNLQYRRCFVLIRRVQNPKLTFVPYPLSAPGASLSRPIFPHPEHDAQGIEAVDQVRPQSLA